MKKILWIAVPLLSLVAAVILLNRSMSSRGEVTPWPTPIAIAPAEQALPREPCRVSTPTKKAFFGDLHVHTALSWDGSARGLENTPDQAYRFARGETVDLPPYDADGRGTRQVTIQRPLDFAAVTDHAETFGEVGLCITPDSPQYGSDACGAFRGEARYGIFPKAIAPLAALLANTRDAEFCGEDLALCRESALAAWNVTKKAAEDWYDRSDDCAFTTFHGYEFTWAPKYNRVHRNVIFRNGVTPELPVTTADETSPEGLWQQLDALCLQSGGDCDVLTIPHNPNHASGMMFPAGDPDTPLAVRQQRAALRANFEPIVEMMQIKGESECRNGLWGVTGAPDEFCDLEKYVGPDAKDCQDGTGSGKSFGRGCVARSDYARYTLAAGMQEQAALGINPFKVGFIGSTDTHNATPGDVEESDWQGSKALSDATPAQRLKPRIARNPGGLAGIWAEKNSRDSLFDAMRRREVFATSGPRIQPRLFAGWNNFSEPDASWCGRSDAIEHGYRVGVPMGGDITQPPTHSGAPYFAVMAHRDAGTANHPGGLLQRVQIIKMTVDDKDEYHQVVHDVVGGPNSASVDPTTCQPQGPGASSLCSVWQDPDFNANKPAAYYVRVIENPSCRWTTWTCLQLPEAERPALCNDDSVTKFTQERAWTSPIWYQPPNTDQQQ